jgi:hypothetical protein
MSGKRKATSQLPESASSSAKRLKLDSTLAVKRKSRRKGGVGHVKSPLQPLVERNSVAYTIPISAPIDTFSMNAVPASSTSAVVSNSEPSSKGVGKRPVDTEDSPRETDIAEAHPTTDEPKPKYKRKKLAPARPWPVVPTSVTASGPRSSHTEGKNYICITRRTQIGTYLRRCKDVVLKDGYVLFSSARCCLTISFR